MARILLIGPDRQRSIGVRSLMRHDGHQVVWLRSSERWRLREREVQPDLIVATVGSTEGLIAPPTLAPLRGFAAPLLLVQQEGDFLGDPHTDERLIDRLGSPFMAEDLSGRVAALVRVRDVIRRRPVADRQAGATVGAARAGRGIKGRMRSWLRSGFPQDEHSEGQSLEVAARAAEWADTRDAFEPGHAARVSAFCAMMAEALGMDVGETADLLQSAMLHDIGKIGLPLEVLRQKRPLEESQRRMIKTHPARGAALLRALDSSTQVARTVLCHHERPDGSGYYGKNPDRVPLSAYVLSVAEEYDAMTSSQLRQPLSSDQAIRILEDGKGTRYHEDCVAALVDSLRPRTTGIALSRDLS